jgi:hypothetical protein
VNLLIDRLPDQLEIGAETYAIRSDFRTGLRIVNALESLMLTHEEKEFLLLANLYLRTPANLPAAFEAAQWFLNGGQVYDDSDAPRVVSFAKDAPLIYAAFRQTHGIDLSVIDLHWWQFIALMQGLDPQSNFRQLIDLRLRVKTGKASPAEIKAARELGDLFDIPEIDTRSRDQIEAEAEFWRLVDQAEQQRSR